jgi:hypothetical protein
VKRNWLVYLVTGARATHLGTVTTPDRDAPSRRPRQSLASREQDHHRSAGGQRLSTGHSSDVARSLASASNLPSRKIVCMFGGLASIWAMSNSDVGSPAAPLDWLVYRVGSPNKLLGTVIAPTLETALAAAFKEFNVTPAGRKRIIVSSTNLA